MLGLSKRTFVDVIILTIVERSTRFGADNIPVGFEMVTRNLRVTNFWPGLIAALTVFWLVVSSRVRLVCPRAVKGRGKSSCRCFGSVLLSARFHIGPQLASR